MPLSEMVSELEAPPERPGAGAATDGGPRLPPDRLGRRLLWAVVVSVLVNAALWRFASQVVRDHRIAPPRPLVVRLVTLPPPPRPRPKPRHKVVHKVVKPKPIKVVRPRPVIPPKPVVRHVAPPKPVTRPVVRPRPASRPPAAHHRTLTAKGPTPARHTALAGGHATLGQPIAHQNAGEGHDNGQQPTPQPAPTLQAVPEPKPQPTLQPEPKPQPKPEPTPPAGPTQDAQPSNQVNPDIPDELKTGDYKSHVRVKVEVHADGSFDASLVTSSGNEEIDRRVLDALKRWKWRPALQNGQPVASTQRFRFDFTVQ